MAYDFYENAKMFAGRLEEIEENEHAASIRAAIRDHFSATEICFALRSSLIDVTKEQLDLGAEWDAFLAKLLRELDKALA